MKKILLLLILRLFVNEANAQINWLPISIDLNIGQYYTALPGGNEDMFVNDSLLYLVRYGGVEVFNLNSGNATYKFSGVYKAGIIKADTGGNFLLVKNSNQLLRYHYPADTFEILPVPVGVTAITDVAVSTGYTWALFNTNIVGRYNGQTWMLDTMAVHGVHLVVNNDSAAYILGTGGNFLFSFNGHAFNYAFAALSNTRNNDPIDIDTRGNIWIADSVQLFEVAPGGQVTTLSDTISPYPGLPLNVQADNLGNVWVSGAYQFIWHYNGQTWFTDTTSFYNYTATGVVDKNNGNFFDLSEASLTQISNGIQSYFTVPDMPYTNITSINSYYISTNQGIFQYNSPTSSFNYNSYFPAPSDFIDTSVAGNPYAYNITCLVNCNNMLPVDSAHALLYGTHHGVFGLNGLINNSMLPDTNINYIYYAVDTYYIATAKGLCIFANNTYTVIDTSNSPLPSNNITYIANACTVYGGLTDNALYIGTDKGMAIRNCTGFTVYDTSYFHTGTANITGIIPAGSNFYNYNPYDSTILISTLGAGLIGLKTDGSYQLCNTVNGYLTSDSVYNVSIQLLGSCGEYLAVAIPGAGIASQYAFSFDQGIGTFSNYVPGQIMLPDSGAFKYYSYIGNNYNNFYAIGIFSQGANLGLTYGGCEGITNIPAPQKQLKWNYQSNNLKVWLPQTYSGPCTLTLYDLQGRVATTIKTYANGADPVNINVSSLASGLYIIQANLNGELLQTKPVIER